MSNGTALREIIALFGFDLQSEELEKGAKMVEGFVGKLKLVGEAVAEAFAVREVKEFFAEQIEGAAHVQDLAERLDVSAASLKELSIVAAGANVGIDELATSLGFMQKTLGDAETKGGEAAQALARLGVSVKDAASKQPIEVIGDLAEGISKLPNQNQRAAAAMAIFGRQGRALLPILSQGREAMAGMVEEAKELTGGLGDDYYEAAKKAREEGERFSFALETIKARVTLAVLPGITKLLLTLKHAAIEFIDFTKRTYVLKTAMIALTAAAGYKLLGTLGALGKALGLLKPTVLETAAAMLEFAAPLLIAAGLYLLFDELFTMMKGGKTIIGDTLNELTGDTEAATHASVILNETWDSGKKVLIGLAGILEGSVVFALMEAWDYAKGFVTVLNDINNLDFDGLKRDFKASITEMKADAYSVADVIKRAAGDVAAGFGNDDDVNRLRGQGASWQDILAGQNAPGGLGAVPDFQGFPYRAGTPKVGGFNVVADATAPRRPVNPGWSGGNASAPVVNQTNNFTTTVQTGSDQPGAVGKAVGQGQATAMQKATNNALIAHRKP